MKTRLACITDAKVLADVHWQASSSQPGGFMFKLGKAFLVQYYRVLLREKNEVILCAEDADGKMIGLVSGTLDAGEHAAELRRQWPSLLMGAIPAIIRDPRLLSALRLRQRSLTVDPEEKGYIVKEGPRLEYWAWPADQRSTMGAVTLLKKWLEVMRLMGAQTVKFEVDEVNQKSTEIHRLLGSRIVSEFVTGEGKKRLIMEYSLAGGKE